MIGFNEAEASLPRNRRRQAATRANLCDASMRPRQACLGIVALTRRRGRQDESIASMRPRQACLGITHGQELPDEIFIASMRPRQACLGIVCLPGSHC